MAMAGKYRPLIAVLRGMLLGAAIYWLAAAADIEKVHIVLAPLLAGMMGSHWPGRVAWRLAGGGFSALLSALLVLIYYFAVAPYAAGKVLTIGVLGIVPFLIAVVFGVLGAAIWEGVRRTFLEGLETKTSGP